jgi:hypothetical protein
LCPAARPQKAHTFDLCLSHQEHGSKRKNEKKRKEKEERRRDDGEKKMKKKKKKKKKTTTTTTTHFGRIAQLQISCKCNLHECNTRKNRRQHCVTETKKSQTKLWRGETTKKKSNLI